MPSPGQRPPSSSRDLTLVVGSESGWRSKGGSDWRVEEYFAQIGLSIGRASNSNVIHIDHPDVALIHAKVVKRGDTFWLRCEPQAKLQILDPEPGEAEEVELIPGLVIELGGVIIRCRQTCREVDKSKRTNSTYSFQIVFLIDLTLSMKPALEELKRNIGTFIALLCCDNRYKQFSWRAKVVGYRDFTDYSASALEDNPFVHNNAEALKSQLHKLRVQGEDMGQSSLLEAIWHIANTEQTDKDAESLDPYKWSHRAPRAVFVFTDASFHEVMKQPEGGTVDDVSNICRQNGIVLNIFAPEADCYDQLRGAIYGYYYPIEIQGTELASEALARCLNNERGHIIEMDIDWLRPRNKESLCDNCGMWWDGTLRGCPYCRIDEDPIL